MKPEKDSIYMLLYEALEDSESFFQNFDGLAISNGDLIVTIGEKDFKIVVLEE